MIAAPDKADLAASAIEDMLFRLGQLIKEHSAVPDETAKDQAEVLAASHLLDFIHQRHGAAYVSKFLSAMSEMAQVISTLDSARETLH